MELKEIEHYLTRIAPGRNPVLTEMETYAEEIHFPIVGSIVGNVLGFFAKLVNARRIFELGSGFGYSALWFALSTAEDTKITCTDLSKSNYDQAMMYFEKAGVKYKIDFKVEDALVALRQTTDPQDIIFNDIEKSEYPEVFNLALDRLRVGGLLITDNTLWHGKVLSNEISDESTRGVLRYNELAFSDKRVHSVLLPIRDGITVSIKLKS